MRNLRAAIIAALFAILLPTFCFASDITLTSRDGTIELQGTLVGYDGEYYRIDTEYGVLTVDGSGVLCDGPGCPDLKSFVANLTFSGAYEITGALLPALLEGFAKDRGYIADRQEISETETLITLFEGQGAGSKAAEITLLLNSSTEGLRDLINEKADFSVSLREVTADEISLAKELGLGNLAHIRQTRILALDAMTPVVARGNPVRRLTMTELAGIFSGEISNWSSVGGEDAEITTYLTEENVGLSDQFVQQILNRWVDAEVSKATMRMSTNQALVGAVSQDPFGIGIGLFSYSGMTQSITLTGECGFETMADLQSIKSEDYPLSAPMYLYFPARRLPKVAREFLRYLRTETAQMAVRGVGLVDQLPVEASVEMQGRRLTNAILNAGDGVGLAELQNMANIMKTHTRLSVTFRFRDGSSALDTPSRSNVLLLAEALEAGQFDGRIMRFVGFADGNGDAEVNQRLALKRAKVVLRAIREAAETLDEHQAPLFVETFGEALPMACDDTAWGRQVNRRVEVWLQDSVE